ncbi:TBP-associated factor 15 isoform 1 [Hibiscus syriacus]|uniref:TBP-associated factor 15 isoform 1 n=1 Tax=Hibiscus syriacus TaxID=106335 RepID=A0A6A3BNJ0_HIBSY|nr:TBP-associated factor 15 isoform 1 [Hibiscus syriacus]
MEKSHELELTQMRKSIEKLGFSTEKYGIPLMSSDGFIADSEVPDQLEARKIFLQDLSKAGHPVLIVQACKHYPPKDHLQFKKFVVYLLDKTIASAVRGREIGNEKLIGILDFQNITYKNVDARGLITGFQFLQAYFPERLAKCYILNMPRFFVSVWRMVSSFIEKATLEKILIVTNEDEKKPCRGDRRRSRAGRVRWQSKPESCPRRRSSLVRRLIDDPPIPKLAGHQVFALTGNSFEYFDATGIS